MSTAKEKKSKRGFMDGYKTYDVAKEGYGRPTDWKFNYHDRMGLDAAKVEVGDDSPHGILGVSKSASWDEIKTAYRSLVMQHHPDRPNGDAAKFRRVQGAYEVLEDIFARKRK